MNRFEVKINGKIVNFLVLAKQQKDQGKWKGWRLDAVASELRREAQAKELANKNKDGDILWA